MGAYWFLLPVGPSRENQLGATLGSASISLGLTYIMTSYVLIAKNQFLHASVPLRLMASVLLVLKYWSERRSMSAEGKRELLWAAAYDGPLSLILGWQLGRWDGRVV
jgi:hypothetical protein